MLSPQGIATTTLAPWASAPASVNRILDRAIDATGGATAWQSARTQTLVVSGSAAHWEPQQAIVPGGEPRSVGKSTFTETVLPQRHAMRTDWVRQLIYPGPREYRFSEVTVRDRGVVLGIDSTGLTGAALKSSPPVHPMAQRRLRTYAREALRASPMLLAEMARDRAQVVVLAPETIEGVAFERLRYRSPHGHFTVFFEGASGMPARVRTDDDDPVEGDSAFDLLLSDWRTVGAIKVAHRRIYRLNDLTVADIQLNSVVLGAPVKEELFAAADVPGAGRSDLPRPAGRAGSSLRGSADEVPWQWFIRRGNMGTLLDTDEMAWDPALSGGLRLESLAEGVFMTQGASHNTLVVEMDDFLVAVDAPVSDAYSLWLLEALRQRFPGKPVRYLALTHHHVDHVAGLRPYLQAGATLLVGAGAGDYWRTRIARPHRLSPTSPALLEPRVTEVSERFTLSDTRREVAFCLIDNPHAASTLMAWVPHARLGFVSDIWSPGRDALGATPTPGQAAVLAAVKRYGLQPLRFAGGHGSVAAWADLERIAMPRVLRVVSGGAAKAAVAPLAEAWAKRTGATLQLEFAPMGAIAQRLGRGENFDLLIMTPEALAPLAAQGRLRPEGAVPIARVGVGVAVSEKAARPDISTPAALRDFLLRSKSVVYIDPAIGTSGRFVVEAFETMGIAAQMAPRTTLGTGGYVVAPVGRGEVEVGIHQVTEILPVPGVVLAGELPPALQRYTAYVAAIPNTSGEPALARQLIEHLTGPDSAPTYQRAGFVTP